MVVCEDCGWTVPVDPQDVAMEGDVLNYCCQECELSAVQEDPTNEIEEDE
jgi:ribosome-binding protein aMBF1 (putative translation factor)